MERRKEERMKDNSSAAAAAPLPSRQPSPIAGHSRLVLSALRGAVAWHDEQGRPYSSSVDADAIATILRLQDTVAVLTASVVEMEAFHDVPSSKADPVWQAIRQRGAAALRIAMGQEGFSEGQPEPNARHNHD